VLVCRDYIQKSLPALKYQLPHVETVTTLKRNRFPYVKAEYGKQDLQRSLLSMEQLLFL
jgi:hypothetical protein